MENDDNLSVMQADEVRVGPAAGVWTGAAASDPVEREAFFADQGFLVFRDMFGQAELRELDAELHRVAANYRDIAPVREGFNVEKQERWPDPDLPVFRKIGGMYDHSEAFRRAAHHPTIVAELQRIMSPGILLWRDVVMMKQARIGREKPWHQDSFYWPYRPARQVSVMTALDPMTIDNGCLQVIPGTHKEMVAHSGAESHFQLTDEQQAQTRYVPLSPGDCLFFHGLLWHGSEPNRSDQHRRVMINSYMPDDLEYTGEGNRQHAGRIV